MFITIEGVDGSGKTTIIKKLIIYLKSRNIDFLFTREPGGTGIKEAEIIRKLLLDNESVIDNMSEAMLYAASRRLNLERNIWPALKAGKVVISDRYFDSSFVYQGFARGLGIDKVIAINDIATDKTYPDMTIYLDVSIEEAEKRIGKRAPEDRMEDAGSAFIKKVYEGYKIIAKKFKSRFVVINANNSPEKVFQDVKKIIDAKLGHLWV